jgi:integrase
MPEEIAKKEVKRIAILFEDNLRKQQVGIKSKDNSVTFKEFAEKWLDRTKTTCSHNYWKKGDTSLKLIYDYFGKDIKLKDINPVMVQGFIDSLTNHKVERKRAKLVGDLRLLMTSKILTLKDLEQMSGVKKCVYERAVHGDNIGYENAEAICKALKINFGDYFEPVIISHNYAKESISNHKRILATILASAKRLRLIEHNYASNDYIEPIRGYKSEIKILNDKEAKKLMKALENEPNIRWKTVLITVLLMGLRRGEICGLEWQDIDFENKTMTISRSSYKAENGTLITKEPKTQNSKRILTMPEKLIKYLLEYKEWWDKRAIILKKRWKGSQRLFLSDSGEVTEPTMYVKWLQKVLARANLPKVTLHSIRHTNITLQLIAGVDIKTVAVRAGHARASTTSDFYSHFIKSSDIHASETINNIFNKSN